jgi:transcriptional regulator with XRE-family HTH domain
MVAVVADPSEATNLLPALLKYWRRRSGLSQLDLALEADVSARHVSFIETGRTRPSSEMVLRLAAALGVPLDQTNELLRAAGHQPAFPESAEGIPSELADVVSMIGRFHEPFPVVVVDRWYQILEVNRAAATLIGSVLTGSPPPDVEAFRSLAVGSNLAELSFDPTGAQPHIVNFDQVGRELLWRIQREALASPRDRRLTQLLDRLLEQPTVPQDWRSIDLAVVAQPTLTLHLRSGELDVRFIAMITAFLAPQNVSAERLRIETWLPADERTAEQCRRLAASS